MKKNLFLRLCLILVVAFSISSCRTDQFPEQETHNNSSKFQLHSKRISLNEAKHKSLILPELEKAQTAFKNSKTNVNGRVIDYGNGVSIDTESVIYIENGPNFHTYTFNIKRENAPADAPLENLLLVPFANGTYKEFLVTYHLTPQEKENISNGYYFYSGADTTITELTAGTFNGNGQLARLSCGWTSETIWTPCSSGAHDGSNFHSCEYLTNPGGTPPSAYTISSYSCAEVKDETIEQIPGPIGGGGSTGGGGAEPCTDCPPEPNTPEPCVQVPTDPTQPSSGMVDENGCAIGLPTLPNNPPVRNNPCAKMKAQNENANFKAKVAELDKPEAFKLKKEKGFAVAYGPQTNYESLNNINNDALTMPIGNKYFAYIHIHLDKEGVVKIFSPADIFTFLSRCVRNAQTNGHMTDAYAMVITSQGNYILKYSGDGNYGLGPNQLTDWKTWYEKEYNDLIENGTFTQQKIEKTFTQFLKEKVNISGLEVYSIDKTTGNATKLEYDGKDNPVKTTPCPLT